MLSQALDPGFFNTVIEHNMIVLLIPFLFTFRVLWVLLVMVFPSGYSLWWLSQVTEPFPHPNMDSTGM